MMNLNNLFPVRRRHNSEPDVFRDLRSEVGRVFDDFNRIFPTSGSLDLNESERYFTQPRIDIRENDKSIDIVVDVPGVSESDIDVQLEGNKLTIKGERSEEKKEDSTDYKVVERSYGSFMRSITLPFDADPDKVDGKLDSGVLTLSIDKPEELEGKVKTVKISASQSNDNADKTPGADDSSSSKTTTEGAQTA